MNEHFDLSPRLKNYREFSGSQLTAEESLRIFGNKPQLLRRVADLASQSLTQHPIQQQRTSIASLVRERVGNGE